MRTLEEIKALVPDKVSLYYVDMNDSLDGQLELVQKVIHEDTDEELYDKLHDWYDESVSANVSNEVEELGLSEEELEEYDDYLRDLIYDRDDSTPIEDLIRNTGKQVFFYDTAYEMEANSWGWDEKKVYDVRKEIKKVLSIKLKDDTWDEYIDMMIRQASYGGQLVVYFYDDLNDYLNIDEKINSISFSNPCIAIIDTCNGSGDHCELSGLELKLPFDRRNLFLDKTIKYSYTYDVCGMVDRWCESTSVKLEARNMKKTIEVSTTHAHLEREARYNKTFKEGSCTAGDMDITRHRDVPYSNDYPCGNRCKSCGTFWVD